MATAIDAAPPPTLGATCRPPEPVTVGTGDGANGDLITYSDLRSTTRAAKKTQETYEPLVGVDLTFFLVWADPASEYWIGRRPDETATPLVRRAFARTKTLRWLLVPKVRAHDRGKGELVLDVFLVDFQNASVVCGVTRTLHGDPRLGTRHQDFVYRNRETGKERYAKTEVHDDYHNDLFPKLEAAVAAAQQQMGVTVSGEPR